MKLFSRCDLKNCPCPRRLTFLLRPCPLLPPPQKNLLTLPAFRTPRLKLSQSDVNLLTNLQMIAEWKRCLRHFSLKYYQGKVNDKLCSNYKRLYAQCLGLPPCFFFLNIPSLRLSLRNGPETDVTFITLFLEMTWIREILILPHMLQ